jgi:hypothetical protein
MAADIMELMNSPTILKDDRTRGLEAYLTVSHVYMDSKMRRAIEDGNVESLYTVVTLREKVDEQIHELLGKSSVGHA